MADSRFSLFCDPLSWFCSFVALCARVFPGRNDHSARGSTTAATAAARMVRDETVKARPTLDHPPSTVRAPSCKTPGGAVASVNVAP